MTNTSNESALAAVQGINHVRVTVTDIARSMEFYTALFGAEPAIDFSDQVGDPEARKDPARFFGGCAYSIGDHIFGLRPSAESGDRFDSTRVGLDHVSLGVAGKSDLSSAAERLDAAGITNGGVQSLEGMGMSILSFQDPDDINLELVAPEE